MAKFDEHLEVVKRVEAQKRVVQGPNLSGVELLVRREVAERLRELADAIEYPAPPKRRHRRAAQEPAAEPLSESMLR